MAINVIISCDECMAEANDGLETVKAAIDDAKEMGWSVKRSRVVCDECRDLAYVAQHQHYQPLAGG